MNHLAVPLAARMAGLAGAAIAMESSFWVDASHRPMLWVVLRPFPSESSQPSDRTVRGSERVNSVPAT